MISQAYSSALLFNKTCYVQLLLGLIGILLCFPYMIITIFIASHFLLFILRFLIPPIFSFTNWFNAVQHELYQLRCTVMLPKE